MNSLFLIAVMSVLTILLQFAVSYHTDKQVAHAMVCLDVKNVKSCKIRR